jgi:ATP-dependent Clp protease protease subunit
VNKPKYAPQFSAKTTGTTLEILIYEEIGRDWWTGEGVTALDVAAGIKASGDFDAIELRINSPGGSCFEGVTIYNLLRSLGKPVSVFIDGMAASAASVIAMAGDTIHMGTGAMLMIHNAAWGIFGDANVLRKAADDIEKVSVTMAQIYTVRTKNDAATVAAMMDAETWMNGAEAVEKGFATDLVDEGDRAVAAKAIAAQFSLKGYKNVPAALKPVKGPRHESVDPGCECPCAACETVGCAGCENDPCTEPGCTCPNHEEMNGPSLEMLSLRHRLRERAAA